MKRSDVYTTDAGTEYSSIEEAIIAELSQALYNSSTDLQEIFPDYQHVQVVLELLFSRHISSEADYVLQQLQTLRFALSNCIGAELINDNYDKLKQEHYACQDAADKLLQEASAVINNMDMPAIPVISLPDIDIPLFNEVPSWSKPRKK